MSAVARAWQAAKADAGHACISWPREWGGAGGTAIANAIFNQEESRAGLQFTYFMTGLHMLLPALMEHNRDDLAPGRIPPAVQGDEIWCQLFSEPSSGSDSAGIRTAAVEVVATATLAGLVGGGGLGQVVLSGLDTGQDDVLLAGAIPVALLALAAQLLFGGVERLATPRGLRIARALAIHEGRFT